MRRLLTAITVLLSTTLLMAQSDLVITAAYDGPLSGGHPKGVELYVINDITDLSVYGLGSANNGGGSDGEEFTFPAVSATSGSYIYVAADSAGFRDFMGFDADYIDGAMAINGDDAIELFQSGAVVDVFGDINVDGNGEPWEYLDGWAYRNDATGPDGSTFALASWSFSGPNALDNETSNSTAATPVPAGTYSPTAGPATFNLTFQVDMSEENPIDDTISVAGNFQAAAGYASDWSPGITELTDPDNDSIYTLTVQVPAGTYEFKYINGASWGNDESVPGACAVNNNREVTVTADAVLDVVCFGKCTPCTVVLPQKSVTFQVDMSNETVSANGVHVAGSFQGWNPSGTQMTAVGNGIYAVTVQIDSGNVEQYKFINGDDWPDAETVPGACGVSDGFGGFNREITVQNDETLPAVLFGTCAPKVTGPPVYDIATVTTVDANGEPDSAGVECELRGVVTSVNFSNNPRLEFFFQDATGGIGLFEFNNDYGYNPVTIGDSVHVQGTIGQFRGLIQINPDTVMVMGQGTLPAPAEVTMLDESTEGELIHMSNVRLADPSQWPNPGSSGNVDIVVCNDTLTMRIDSNTEVDDSVSAPTGTFNLTGIGSQFDFSSPYLEGYQVFPRIPSDIMPVASHIISDYKGVDANGEADSLNADVVFEGIVTSVDYDGNSGVNFFMQDATAGIALFNFNDVDVNGSPYQVTMGDELRVHGTIDQFRGLTQVFVDSIEVLCQGKMLPMPMVVDSLGEFTEGQLIRINDAELVDASQWPSAGSNASVDIKVGMDTLVLRIDRDTEVDDSVSAPSGTFDIVGVGSQFTFGPPFAGGYQILPRVPSDIIAAPSTVGVPCADLYISEYFEGSGNNKGFEIYNPTDNAIDLSNYTIELSGNGGSFLNSFVLDGQLASKDVYIVTTDQADSAALAVADTALGFPSVAHFSGDDALYLLKGNDTLDIIGEVGIDPGSSWPVGNGSTRDNTLVRKSNVFNGTTDWAIGATQWEVFPQNFLDSLGAHTQDDCGSAIIPDLSISPTAVDVLQYEGSTTIDVVIANPNNDTTEVEVYVKGGTATNGTDFNFMDTTVTFLPGSASPVSLAVEIINQPGAQPNRTVVLGLRNATNNATISADTSLITIIDVPYYPIATVHGEDADGVADSNGVFCELRGVVTTGIDFRGGNGLTFYITDPTGSINVFSFSDVSGYVVTEGDSVHIIGQIEQFRGLTEIIPDSIQVVSQGNAIPAPRVVSMLDENTESELVQLYGWSFVDTMQWDNSSFSGFNVDVTNGTDTLVVRIDNDSELYSQPAPDPNKVYAITGLGSQYSGSSAPFLDGYQLFPRYLTDLEEILAPAADFSFTTAQLDVDFTDLSTNDPTSWAWDFGDGNSSTDQNPTHSYASGGKYEVCLTATNVAGSDEACDSVTVIGVGIDNALEANAALEVFPNPTQGQLTIRSTQTIESVTVVNTNGQVVAARWIGDVQTHLGVAQLPAGTYFVVVNYEEGQLIRQVVKH